MALSGESRFVLLASSNAHKVQEYANLLSLYGIDVRQSDPRVFKDYAELGETPVAWNGSIAARCLIVSGLVLTTLPLPPLTVTILGSKSIFQPQVHRGAQG